MLQCFYFLFSVSQVISVDKNPDSDFVRAWLLKLFASLAKFDSLKRFTLNDMELFDGDVDKRAFLKVHCDFLTSFYLFFQ